VGAISHSDGSHGFRAEAEIGGPWCACSSGRGRSTRKGVEGLAALGRALVDSDPFDGAVDVFRAKRGNRVEAGFLGRHGRAPVCERVEDGRFQWPQIGNGVMRLSAAQLSALVECLYWRASARRKTRRLRDCRAHLRQSESGAENRRNALRIMVSSET
jgi:transposase